MDNTLNNVRQMAIVGTGLLGASVGLGLKAAGFTGRIIGLGRRIETVRQAADRGAVDEACEDFSVLRDCQLVLVAVPLGAFAGIFEKIAPHDHEALVITDVGSTKTQVVALAGQLLPHPARFVGSHPMAGSEQRGPEAAEAQLCRGKPCILTPQSDTDPAALRLVDALWRTLGMKMLSMSPQEHDRATAAVSHLPHAASVLLIHTAAKLGGFDVASTGFRDTTRLASSNPPMRADIMLTNRDCLLQALEAYENNIGELKHLLRAGDQEKLIAWLTEAQRVRDQWNQRRD
ncbi:MAG: prephenate dehydrogenase [Phycisphaeraceae bacterium]|nr:prephenate dehydrogenase [Phycisphaeraceae bacterium]